ncbi:MAG TPA: DsbA family protein [Candidatus Limnocylindrales bacterium]|nr:DsbA family protein [Candidatus Limnocylindrales bacterium]
MVEVGSGTVVVFSDIGCPWAHVAVWRLWDARRRLGLEDRVRLDHRVFPLELFNSEPTPRNELEPEMPICASLAPRAGWQAWSAPDWAWPATMLPPMEAVQAAKEQGLAISEALDRGLRRAFWGESRCISLRHVILEVASETDGLDLAALAAALDDGRARRAIFADWEVAKSDAVQGSPHLFAPDGTNAQNPGLEMDWNEGDDGIWLPTILRDDTSAYEDLLQRALA